MNRCSHVQHDLPLFVGGDLEPRVAAMVSVHLRECPVCRREAAGLQQAHKRLVRLAAPAVDERWFASMNTVIGDRLAAEVAPGQVEAPRLAMRWWWSAAAAAALFVLGWSMVRPPAPAALGRAPIAIPVGHAGPSLAVPYAGERVPLQLLGDDVWAHSDWADGGEASGMLGRWRLRSLVDEEFEVPLPGASDPSPMRPAQPK
jgi:anti-sigma factor RsiW